MDDNKVKCYYYVCHFVAARVKEIRCLVQGQCQKFIHGMDLVIEFRAGQQSESLYLRIRKINSNY